MLDMHEVKMDDDSNKLKIIVSLMLLNKYYFNFFVCVILVTFVRRKKALSKRNIYTEKGLLCLDNVHVLKGNG